jgi:hypothetical protein
MPEIFRKSIEMTQIFQDIQTWLIDNKRDRDEIERD